MDFLTMSLEDVTRSSKYVSLLEPHLLISIRSRGQKVDIPKNHYKQSELILEFDDVQMVNINDTFFDADVARKILNFVDAHCSKANLIVCHCYAGLSRSAAVCAALSKILNNTDDHIFANKMPNMLVYCSLLEEYFLTPDYDKVYRAIWYLRERSLKRHMSPMMVRLAQSRIPRNAQDLEKVEEKEEKDEPTKVFSFWNRSGDE